MLLWAVILHTFGVQVLRLTEVYGLPFTGLLSWEGGNSSHQLRLANSSQDDIARAPTWKDTLKAGDGVLRSVTTQLRGGNSKQWRELQPRWGAKGR